MLGRGGAPAALVVDEVDRIRPVGGGEIGQADSDQAEFRAVGFALEKVASGREYPGGKLGRRA